MLYDDASEKDRVAAITGHESAYLAEFLDFMEDDGVGGDGPVADVIEITNWIERANQAMGGR